MAYHPPFVPPKKKSIFVHCEVSVGVVNPVKVAKFFETLLLGAAPRRSVILKSLSWSPTAYLAANVALIATGAAAPVMILYPPESLPVAGLTPCKCHRHPEKKVQKKTHLLKSPCTKTGALVVTASNLARVRSMEPANLR